MTEIGFVIQPGQTIPGDVTAFTSSDGEQAKRTEGLAFGLWADEDHKPECAGHAYDDFAYPLTVTAVREQPAEPDDVHYYFTELRTGLTYCGVSVEDDFVETTSESGKATCVGCLAAAGEDAPAVEPQPESDLLDLVRQYAHKRVVAAVLRQDGSDEAAELRAEEHADLWTRIEAEVWRLRNERDLADSSARELAVTVNELTADAAPDPLVLRLPEVPGGAVALIGGKTGTRYEPDDGAWSPEDSSFSYSLVEVLEDEGSVTVELVPPREPRTWKQLDEAPEGVCKVEVRRSDGAQYLVVRRRDGLWAHATAHPNPEAAEIDETYTWGELLGDGDVTEVFDDEAGTR